MNAGRADSESERDLICNAWEPIAVIPVVGFKWRPGAHTSGRCAFSISDLRSEGKAVRVGIPVVRSRLGLIEFPRSLRRRAPVLCFLRAVPGPF